MASRDNTKHGARDPIEGYLVAWVPSQMQDDTTLPTSLPTTTTPAAHRLLLLLLRPWLWLLLTTRKLRRKHVASRFGRTVYFRGAHAQLLGGPPRLREKLLAHTALGAAHVDEEGTGPDNADTSWSCWRTHRRRRRLCGPREQRREQPGEKKRSQDVDGKVVFVALGAGWGVVPCRYACIVEPVCVVSWRILASFI